MKVGWSKLMNLKRWIVKDEFDVDFVFKRLVLSVNVHGCVATRAARLSFTGFFSLLRDQITVRIHADVVVLERRRISGTRPLDSHGPSNRGEEPDLLPFDPDWLLLLTCWAPKAGKTINNWNDLCHFTDQIHIYYNKNSLPSFLCLPNFLHISMVSSLWFDLFQSGLFQFSESWLNFLKLVVSL